MTKVKCDMTDCKYNSSCCSSPCNSAESFCTKESIALVIDEEMNQLECDSFEPTFDKPIECNKCQMQKYGGIKLNKEKIQFEPVQ